MIVMSCRNGRIKCSRNISQWLAGDCLCNCDLKIAMLYKSNKSNEKGFVGDLFSYKPFCFNQVIKQPIYFFTSRSLFLTASDFVYLTTSFTNEGGAERSGLLKIAPTGNPIWFRELSTTNFTFPFSYLVVENSQSDLLLFAQRNAALGISKLDNSGNLIFDRQINLDALTGVFDTEFVHFDQAQSTDAFVYLVGSLNTSSVDVFPENTGFIHKVNDEGLTSAVWTIANFTPYNIGQNDLGNLILIGNTKVGDVLFPAIVQMNAKNGDIIQADYVPLAFYKIIAFK